MVWFWINNCVCSLQNSMRATLENHEASSHLPPIKVMVALGGEDLSIKVSHWEPLVTNLCPENEC